jgi:hypothetical protein
LHGHIAKGKEAEKTLKRQKIIEKGKTAKALKQVKKLKEKMQAPKAEPGKKEEDSEKASIAKGKRRKQVNGDVDGNDEVVTEEIPALTKASKLKVGKVNGRAKKRKVADMMNNDTDDDEYAPSRGS